MATSGDCPHCGYAMNRELDRVCPRCKRAPDEILKAPPTAPKPAAPPPIMPPRPAAAPVAAPPAAGGARAPLPGAPPAPGAGVAPHPHAKPRKKQGAGTWLLGIGGGFLLLLVLIFGVAAISQQARSPEHKGRVAVLQAVGQLEEKQWDQAVASCRKAQEVDPQNAEASFVAALATMQMCDEDSAESQIQVMMNQASAGQTQMCNTADAWLKDCVARCEKSPERRTVDRTLRDYTRMKANAEGLQSATAIVRAAAAMQTGHDEDASAWLGVAEKHIKAGETADASCRLVKEMRKGYDEIVAARHAASVRSAPTLEQQLRSLQGPRPN